MLNLPKLLSSMLLYCVLGNASFFLMSSASLASTELPNFVAHYKANIKGLKATAIRELKDLENGQKEISFKADSLIASLEERSRFNYQDNKLLPSDYKFRLKVFGKTFKRDTHFDHNTKTITNFERGKTYQPEYSPDALDNLSYQLQLQHDLNFNSGELKYQLIKKDELKERIFTVIGEETIVTPMGEIRTLKVALEQEKDNKRKTYFWVSPEWNCLLVRFEQYENGKKDFVIDLVDATIDNVKVAGL